MKKIISYLAAAAIVAGLMTTAALADDTAEVYVTIANGELVMTQQAVELVDADGDGALTINDALYLAHEKAFDGGAAAGYASAESEWGLSLTKLWGVENGGSYGYYVNNASAMGLTDPVKDGDYINAFVYTDTTAYSDAYCFFDKESTAVISGEEFTLTLSAAAFDENWAPITKPVADAVITVNGQETSYKTDADGKVALKVEGTDKAVISAKSASAILVPPACTVYVSEKAPQTSDAVAVSAMLVSAVAMLGTGYAAFAKKNND